jgi:ankyrin repeat protein
MENSEYNELITRGNTSLAKNEYDSALKDFNEAIELDAEDARGFVGRGIVHTKKDDTNAAIADFNTALKLNPKSIDLWQHYTRPIFCAAICGNLEIIKFLVENGADVNVKDFLFGKTPLFDAAHNGRLGIVKYLIENGADVNVKAYSGETPLCRTIGLDVIKYLVKNGADVNVKSDAVAVTPLSYAIYNSDFIYDVDNVSFSCLKIVKYLVENGADVNLKDTSGKTPLFVATFRDDLEVIKYLVKNGADVNAKNNDDQTVLDYVEEYVEKWGHEPVNGEVKRFLIEAGCISRQEKIVAGQVPIDGWLGKLLKWVFSGW